MAKTPKVVFMFSHPFLPKAWDDARALLAARGVSCVVADQTQRRDWAAFAAEDVGKADALYLDLTPDFEGFDLLLDAAMGVPLVVPGGAAVAEEWTEPDRGARATMRSCFGGGAAEDLAGGALWLLRRCGRWRMALPRTHVPEMGRMFPRDGLALTAAS